MFTRLPLVFVILVMGLGGDDTHCPAYPSSERVVTQQSLARERLLIHRNNISVNTPFNANLIDQYIFGKMIQDGVQPAPLTGDAEFLRRVTMHLSRRVPPSEARKSRIAA